MNGAISHCADAYGRGGTKPADLLNFFHIVGPVLAKAVEIFAPVAQPQTSMFGGLVTLQLGKLVLKVAGKNKKNTEIPAIVPLILWLPQPVAKPSAHPPRRPLFPNRQQFVSSPRRFGNGAFFQDEEASILCRLPGYTGKFTDSRIVTVGRHCTKSR